ncbi:MAG: DUF302 domain-containing protein [Gammaproteobacteria bacterium]|nr:DUF302 domain-containing protein [Gammaproteobacteria bacterium]MCW8958989.1 DUF302 domain-containing protein [Gammaproteobacteria bacterium]MCW8972639.1 DUF302 domain-containing protein [Gammaproteobacteria bacterium]MCW8992032.1 DUF302 domain-containing protein [Gammaproteobacteria bacterium]MCW9089107.1 DUF302 domain-containing protein [Gammaproteobacteria bacterium]
MKRPLRLLSALLLALLLNPLAAEEESLLMMRSSQSFPEAMLAVQKTLGEYGYTVSRVQRVDIGLTASGFETDRYRIVFFGKPEEIRHLSGEHPELIPYLPLKMTIFAEQDETLLVALDPTALDDIVDDEAFAQLTMRWKNDIIAIMDELREY